MIPKYRMWNRITSKLHRVDGLYFDNKEVQYIDEVGILRFIKFENTILMQWACTTKTARKSLSEIL